MPDHFTLLLEWRRAESSTRGLAKLPHDFYPATAAYLAETRRAYESELRENPSGKKGDIARQTYQRASSIARDLVEGRSQKIVSAAFQASIGGPKDVAHVLPEERTLFDSLLLAFTTHRRLAAPYLEGQAGVRPPVDAGRAPGAPSPPVASPADAPPSAPELAWVRILQDGRPIEVGTETVDLRADDVLSLPAETARLLIAAKVAEPIRPGAARPVT
jgi:DNA replication initiation complex subunit (GINS family)